MKKKFVYNWESWDETKQLSSKCFPPMCVCEKRGSYYHWRSSWKWLLQWNLVAGAIVDGGALLAAWCWWFLLLLLPLIIPVAVGFDLLFVSVISRARSIIDKNLSCCWWSDVGMLTVCCCSPSRLRGVIIDVIGKEVGVKKLLWFNRRWRRRLVGPVLVDDVDVLFDGNVGLKRKLEADAVLFSFCSSFFMPWSLDGFILSYFLSQTTFTNKLDVNTLWANGWVSFALIDPYWSEFA